jgi:F-type H+-transporting ATPase subunit gamma
MPSLKEIRIRISSVSSTRQITSAMKMVSAAKLRRAQDGIVRLRPYAEKLHDILSNISRNTDTAGDNKYARQREPKNVLIIVVTSNRGLCGSFNASVIRQAIHLAETRYETQLKNKRVSFMAIGKKAADYLKAKNYNLVSSHNELFENLSFEHVSPFAQSVMDEFVAGKYDKIELVYNQFKNAAVQILSTEQFLPIEIKQDNKAAHLSYDYIFEPSKEFIVQELIPKSLKIQIYKALLDSNAAEHGARMTAMHKATDNATDMLRDLRLTYNKARQASITKEILEIVAGAEALKG